VVFGDGEVGVVWMVEGVVFGIEVEGWIYLGCREFYLFGGSG